MNNTFLIKRANISIFKLGVFLLPTAISFSLILFLISIFLTSIQEKIFTLNSNYKKFFFISSIFLIISSVIHSFSKDEVTIASLSWIGLLNWIPLFILFFVFRFFLEEKNQRENISTLILAGSLPIIITGLGQVFFNWNGPWVFLNGLITWYQKPLDYTGGLSGIFNNVNYASAWLNIIYPMSLAKFSLENSKYKKIIFLIYTSLIFICIILTNSRASWVCLIFSNVLFLRKKFIKFSFFIISFLSAMLISSTLFKTFREITFSFLYAINPYNLDFNNYINQITFIKDRLDYWGSAIKIIIQNPIFGKGVDSFSKIYFSETNQFRSHSHNLVLEMAVNYGLPATLIIIFPIIMIIYLSFKHSFVKEKILNFDQSLITALLASLILHLVDIQYYDGRISIVSWLLLAGMSNIFIKKNSA